MSNANIRAHLARASAPVVAFLIDNGWVSDDCGILNSRYGNIREGLLVASRATQGMRPTGFPELGSSAAKPSQQAAVSSDTQAAKPSQSASIVRERL